MKQYIRRFVASTGITASLVCASAVAGPALAGSAPIAQPVPVHCATDSLQTAIDSAAAGSTLNVSGTCVGAFTIAKNLTLNGPAVLDGGNGGTVLTVTTGTVTLNAITIQNGSKFAYRLTAGGIDNAGLLTLNRCTVDHNAAIAVGGIFNTGSVTMNLSTVSNNFGVFTAGGIDNEGTAVIKLSSITSNHGNNGTGGLLNSGTASLALTSVTQNNGGGAAGGIANTETGTLNLLLSLVTANTDFAPGAAGGVSNLGTMHAFLTRTTGNISAP